MLDMTKGNAVLDIIHDTIVYSGLEFEIINTPIFNRLQRISQSSLAFLTFPSNKVKRFEHSIGTMYLSGEIFYNSICNAEEKLLNSFMEKINEKIIEWRKGTSQNGLPKELKNIKGEQILIDAPYPKSSFYYSYIPANLNPKYIFSYLVILESIRVAGLLHDVGHLPYSHILEKALKNLYERAEGDVEIDETVKEEFLNIMHPFVKGKDAIHEEFGKLLVNSIKQCILDNLTYKQKNEKEYFFILLVFDFAQKILCSKFTDNNIFADIHLIISGAVDADRLDYCTRDSYCAGTDKSIFNYKQFFDGYKLIYTKIEDWETSHYLFSPSFKNLLLVEELLRKRYRIYADINYHHRVHKHEIILEKVICELGLIELKNLKEIKSLPDVLPLEVSSIWKLVKEIKNDTTWLEYQLIQMDDSWLDTLLKHSFFELYKNNYSSIKEHGNKTLWNQFNELISTKKHYCSLIKRSGDFQFVDKMLYESCVEYKWKNSKIQAKIEKFKTKDYNTFVNENKSLFFNYCKYICKDLGLAEKRDVFYQAVENLYNKNLPLNVLNCIIRSSRFSCGLATVKSPVFLNGENGEEVMLGQLSFQRNSFLIEEAMTPAFHFYYLPDYDETGVPCEIDKKELIKVLSTCIIQCMDV